MKTIINLPNCTLTIESKEVQVIETRDKRITIEYKNSDGFTPYNNPYSDGFEYDDVCRKRTMKKHVKYFESFVNGWMRGINAAQELRLNEQDG